MKVLVIDDTKEEREGAIIQLGLLHPFIELTVADGAKTGLQELIKGGWDVVLTDLMMPHQEDSKLFNFPGKIGELLPFGAAIAVCAANKKIPTAIVTCPSRHRSLEYDLYVKEIPSFSAACPEDFKFQVFIDSSCPRMADGRKNWGEVLCTVMESFAEKKEELSITEKVVRKLTGALLLLKK